MPRERPLILVADDDEQIQRLIRITLTAAGYDVETVTDGIAALDAIERLRPDLVILDMIMPKLNGWGVLRRMSGRDAPPVIAVSGEYQPANALTSAISCVRGYAIKPLQMRSLVHTCAQILGTKADAPALSTAERRCEPRYPFETAVTLLGVDLSALAVGRSRDISRGGLCLQLGIGLVRDQTVRLQLDLPECARPLLLRAAARWSLEGRVGFALRDVEPPSRAQLDTFIDSRSQRRERAARAAEIAALRPGIPRPNDD
jgi:DNA-binding response OmpR family regulator